MSLLKAAAVLAFVGAVSAASPLRGPCDLKSVEKKAWCPACVMYVPRADVRAGSCPKDKARIELQDVCVKQIYVAKCHPTTTGLKPVSCCGVTYDKGTDDLAKIEWVCVNCKEKSLKRDFKHAETCTGAKATKTCEKSGTSPHSTFGK